MASIEFEWYRYLFKVIPMFQVILHRIFMKIQWTLIITNSLGPVKLLCYIEILLYPGCKNNKIQRNFELWDQENYFVIYLDFVIWVFFIMRVHCNIQMELYCIILSSRLYHAQDVECLHTCIEQKSNKKSYNNMPALQKKKEKKMAVKLIFFSSPPT